MDDMFCGGESKTNHKATEALEYVNEECSKLVEQRGEVEHAEHTRTVYSSSGPDMGTETIHAHECGYNCDNYSSEGCCDICPRQHIMTAVYRQLLAKFDIAGWTMVDPSEA